MDDGRLTAQLRLFGLLTLLVPLFAGLQYVVREGVPRVEVRLVAQDAQTNVPVERVVERVVYVPVMRQASQPSDNGFEPVRVSLPSAPSADAAPLVDRESRDMPGQIPPAEVAEGEPEEPAPDVVAVTEPATDVAPLTGTVARVPAPVVAQAPARRAVPVIVAAPPPPEAEEVAEVAETGEAAVATDESPAEADGEEVIAEASSESVEVEPGERVALFVSEVPVARLDNGSSIATIQHVLYAPVSNPAPEAAAAEAPGPAPEEEAVDEVAEPLAEETEAVDEVAEPLAEEPEASEDGAVEPEEAVSEPEAPVEEAAAPVGGVIRPTTEQLLSEATSVRSDMAPAASSNGGSVIAEIEHQLIARPAGTEQIAQHAGEQPAQEQQGEAVAASESEAEEPAEEAVLAEDAGPAEEAAVAEIAEGDVAVVESASAVEDESEQ